MHDDADIQRWLSQLHDGTSEDKIEAREGLARVFEQRGMLDEATDLVVNNVRAGVRDADTFRWLARLYRAQGNETLAAQAAAEASKYLTPAAPPMDALAPADQAAVPGPVSNALDAEIRRYAAAGYRVVSQTPTSAQLVKPKEFSLPWSVLWFFVCGVGVLVYIFYYLAKQDTIVHLSLNDDGTVRAQPRSARPELGGQWLCPSCGYANSARRQVCKRSTCRAPRA
jgi:hypothetical protein